MPRLLYNNGYTYLELPPFQCASIGVQVGSLHNWNHVPEKENRAMRLKFDYDNFF